MLFFDYYCKVGEKVFLFFLINMDLINMLVSMIMLGILLIMMFIFNLMFVVFILFVV